MRYLIVFVLLLMLLVGGLWWTWGPRLDPYIASGVWLWELPVGGQTPEEAWPAIEDYLRLREPRIVLVGPDGQRWSFSPADLGLSVDREATLLRLSTPGHDLDQVAALNARLDLLLTPQVLSPVYSWEPVQAQVHLAMIAAEVAQPSRSARILLTGDTLTLLPGVTGRRVSVTETLALVEPALSQHDLVELLLPVEILNPEVTDAEAARALNVAQAILEAPLTLLVPDPRDGDPGPWVLSPQTLSTMLHIETREDRVAVNLDETALTEYLNVLAAALRRAPEDAQFRFDSVSGQLVPITQSTPGRELNVEETLARIQTMLPTGQHFIPLLLESVEPQYPAYISAADLGIRELVGVGESYFTGSSSARDRNIRLGAAQFQGVIVAPGETFSFNEHLGEISVERGYDESYVIIGNRTVMGVGGGICQVTTTAFRAAYNAGYPIIERWPHAYRVSYYELGGFGPGFDATVYSPIVDFRFINDTPHHLLIETEVVPAQQRLVFRFYSTSMGRTVEQLGPTWGTPEPPGAPVYEYNPDLPMGAVQQIERAYDGLTARLGRVVRDSTGQVLYEDTFISRFIPWPARYEYGPGFIPPPDSTP